MYNLLWTYDVVVHHINHYATEIPPKYIGDRKPFTSRGTVRERERDTHTHTHTHTQILPKN